MRNLLWRAWRWCFPPNLSKDLRKIADSHVRERAEFIDNKYAAEVERVVELTLAAARSGTYNMVYHIDPTLYEINILADRLRKAGLRAGITELDNRDVIMIYW